MRQHDLLIHHATQHNSMRQNSFSVSAYLFGTALLQNYSCTGSGRKRTRLGFDTGENRSLRKRVVTQYVKNYTLLAKTERTLHALFSILLVASSLPPPAFFLSFFLSFFLACFLPSFRPLFLFLLNLFFPSLCLLSPSSPVFSLFSNFFLPFYTKSLHTYLPYFLFLLSTLSVSVCLCLCLSVSLTLSFPPYLLSLLTHYSPSSI